MLAGVAYFLRFAGVSPFIQSDQSHAQRVVPEISSSVDLRNDELVAEINEEGIRVRTATPLDQKTWEWRLQHGGSDKPTGPSSLPTQIDNTAVIKSDNTREAISIQEAAVRPEVTILNDASSDDPTQLALGSADDDTSFAPLANSDTLMARNNATGGGAIQVAPINVSSTELDVSVTTGDDSIEFIIEDEKAYGPVTSAIIITDEPDADIPFGDWQIYDIEESPTLETGWDLNGDGFSDLIAGFPNDDGGRGKFLVFLGSPNGLETTESQTFIGTQINDKIGDYFFGVGDINGDDFPDFETRIAGVPAVMFGNGSGLDAPQITLSFPWNELRPAGDINDDSYMDFLDSSQSLFLGTQSGLSTTASFIFGGSPEPAGDIDGDSFDDFWERIDHGTNPDSVGILYGNVNGNGFGTPSDTGIEVDDDEDMNIWGLGPLNPQHQVVMGGDFNGDGRTDIVITRNTANSFFGGVLEFDIHYGTTNRMFSGTADVTLETGAASDDIAKPEKIRLINRLEGLRDGLWVEGEEWNPAEPISLDIFHEFAIQLSLPTTTVTLTEPEYFPLENIADFNGDGVNDVVRQHVSPQFAVTVDHSHPRNPVVDSPGGIMASLKSFGDPTVMPVREFYDTVAGLADINGDGLADFGFGPEVYLGHRENNFPLHRTLPNDVSYGGDINNDGRADVISNDSIYTGSDTGLNTDPVWVEPSNFKLIHVGDVNGDGIDDVAGVNLGETGTAVIYGGDTDATMSQILWNYNGHIEKLFPIGDPNADGFDDIAITGDEEVNIFYSRGSFSMGTPSGPQSVPSLILDRPGSQGFGFHVNSVGDLNRDGFQDIGIGAPFSRNDSAGNGGILGGGRIYYYQGSPTGLSSAPTWVTYGVDGEPGSGITLHGENAGLLFDGQFDWDGDGFDDVIFGKFDRTFSFGADGTPETGIANGFMNSEGDTLAAPDFQTVDTEIMGVGHLTRLGDVNGDGSEDFGMKDVLDGTGNYAGIPASIRTMKRQTPDEMIPWQKNSTENNQQGTQGGFSGIVDGVKFEFENNMDVEAKLEFEIKPAGLPFDQQNLFRSPDWIAPGQSGEIIFNELSSSLPYLAANGYHWRSRPVYRPSSSRKRGHGIWTGPLWVKSDQIDFRSLPNYGRPTPPTLTITPGPVFADVDLLCEIDTPGQINPVFNPLQYEYTWKSQPSNLVVPRALTEATSDTLSLALTTKGETWTCEVRTYDGHQFSDIASAAVSVVNHPLQPPQPMIPGPPSESNPDVVLISDAQNLVCELNKGLDRDGDIKYLAIWFRDGVEFSRENVVGDKTQIDLDDVNAGERWFCRIHYAEDSVTDTDSFEDTSIAAAESGGVIESAITLDVAPIQITLGQSVNATGLITPKPIGASEIIFDSTDPFGDEIEGTPEFTLTNSNGEFSKEFFPAQATEGRAPWKVNARWEGDDKFRGAKTTDRVFTVLKARPDLSISLSHNAAPKNFNELTAQISFDALLHPDLNSLRAGKLVKLFLREPAGDSRGPIVGITNEFGIATITPQDFADAGITFDNAGTWQFIADFEEDDNFLDATSAGFDTPNATRFIVKDGAGHVILLVGALDDASGGPGLGEGQREHTKTMDFVYRSFISRGFDPEDIYYFREPIPGQALPPDIQVDDATPSQNEFLLKIKGWKLSETNESPAPLYVAMIDHGAEEEFFVFSGAFNNDRIITPEELDEALDLRQSFLSPEARSEGIVVINGSCHSGSFIPALAGPNRTIITSSKAEEISHRGPLDPEDDIRDGEYFVTELFRELRAGKSIKDAFAVASLKIQDFTVSRSNSADEDAELPQEPLLDDNGDGIGTTSPELQNEQGRDGSRSASHILGFGVNAGDAVGWVFATENTVLKPTAPTPVLAAKATQPPSEDNKAFIVIKPPGYKNAIPAATGGIEGSDENLGDFQQVLNLDPIPSTLGDELYQWTSLAGKFDVPGTYQVYYFIKDGETGEISTYLRTTIVRQSSANQPPEDVALVFPEDGSLTATLVTFGWTTSVDPDGNAVTYTFEMDTDATFSSANYVRLEGIASTFLQQGALMDGETYYWRVTAIDEFGTPSATSDVSRFTVDAIGNDPFKSSLTMRITDALGRRGILTASILLSHPDENDLSGTRKKKDEDDGPEQNEYYILGINKNDRYTLTVEAPGYVTNTIFPLNILAGTHTPLAIELEPDINHALGGGSVTSEIPPDQILSRGRLELVAPPGGFNYQWIKQNVGYLVDDPPRITGTQTRILVIDPLFISDTGKYMCLYETGGTRDLVITDPFKVSVISLLPNTRPLGLLAVAAMIMALACRILMKKSYRTAFGKNTKRDNHS